MLSDLCACPDYTYLLRDILSRGLMWLKTELRWQQIGKVSRSSLMPSTNNVSLLARDKYWYVLSSSVCRGSPGQLLKKDSLVSSFPDEFRTEEAHFGWPMETVVTVRPTLNKYL